MRTKVSVVLAAVMLVCQWGWTQVDVSARSNTRLQDTRRWQKDIDKYKDVLEDGEFPAVMEKLADCYRMTGELDKAESWYRKSIVNGNESSDCRLNYARVLQSNGKYQEAKSQFKLYEEVSGEYNVGEKYIASCDMAMKVKDEDGRYVIRAVDEVNTVNSDIVAINGKQEVIFATRSKKRAIGTDKKIGEEGDYDFFTAFKRSKGRLAGAKPIKGKVRSRHDDVNAVKMPGSDVVLFTRIGESGNSTKVPVEVGNNKDKKVRILGARIRGSKGNKWDEIENLPYNFSDGSANFHPAIHPSGDVIVFASDRPGGYGGVDLYTVRREGGKWSEPRNLGPEINTEGDELFPSYNNEGYIFFASDGHIGYGGLDIYTADFQSGRFEDPVNMGSGINSSKDDFGIVWDPKTSSGYFSSNRKVETGDDIYYFKRRPGITGQVFDGMSRDDLPGSIVRLKDISGNEKVIITDGAGRFSEPCKVNSGYLITVDAPGFTTYRDTFWTKNIPQGRDVNLDVYLEIEQLFEMSGLVFDALNDSLLGESRIRIISSGKVIDSMYTGAEKADYKFRLAADRDYSIIYEQDEYIPRVANVSIGDIRGIVIRENNVPMVKGNYVLVHGTILEDGDVTKPMAKASVVIVNNETQEVIDSTMSVRDGSFYVAIPWEEASDYSIISAKEGFLSTSMEVVRPDSGLNEVTLDFLMQEARYGLDNNMKIINYAYNQSELDILSKKDLNEIFFFLRENPEAKLEVRSHTDARGTKSYNLNLSRRRSESVVRYIQERRNLPDERFISWGFGEEYLLNDCADGTKCDEEEHALNRRTELKLVER